MSDFDGDGYIDAVDTDGDGYLDTFDTDADGYADKFDLDGDGFADGYDVDGDGFVDTTAASEAGTVGGGTTFLDDDQYYTEAEQAVGYSASDTSFIEPASYAGSTSLISDNVSTEL